MVCWFVSINWTAEAITAAATIALAFLTFVLAFGTLFLWLATKRLVVGSEKTAKRQLRAYVCIEIRESDAERFMVVAPGRGLDIPLRMVNRGQTPAHDVIHQIVVGINPFYFTEGPLISTDASVSPSVLGPEQDALIVGRFERPLSNQEIRALTNSFAVIFVEGVVFYKDIFNDKQFTTYRMYLQIDSRGTFLGIETAPTGNKAS